MSKIVTITEKTLAAADHVPTARQVARTSKNLVNKIPKPTKPSAFDVSMAQIGKKVRKIERQSNRNEVKALIKDFRQSRKEA